MDWISTTLERQYDRLSAWLYALLKPYYDWFMAWLTAKLKPYHDAFMDWLDRMQAHYDRLPPLRRPLLITCSFLMIPLISYLLLSSPYTSSVFPSSLSPQDPVLPWEETGFPAQQKEVWRARVCNIHFKVWRRNPHAKPAPLHSILNLDATSSPFTPADLSSQPNLALHPAVINAITEAYTAQSGPYVRRLASAADDDSRDAEDQEWYGILSSTMSVLSEDLTRNNYARQFVPALVNSVFDGWREDHTIAEDRMKCLKALCA